jgi:hypothetical protein
MISPKRLLRSTRFLAKYPGVIGLLVEPARSLAA